jgi:hypothetical protein
MGDKRVTDELIKNLYLKPKKDKGVNAPRFGEYEPHYIYQADLLFLPHDDKFKYALVVVDIGSRLVDAFPIKDKTQIEIIKGFNKIFHRKPLQHPPKIIEVDSGSEFKGKVKSWIIGNNIALRVKRPYRHNQQAIVERKNQEIGKKLFIRMTAEEILTNSTSTSWAKYLPIAIKEINQQSEKSLKNKKVETGYICQGDACKTLEQRTKVRIALDAPIDVVSGKRLPGNFRESDIRWSLKPHVIMETLIQPGQPPLYLVDDGKGKTDRRAAYTKNQLQVIPSNEKLPDSSIIHGQKNKGVVRYIVEKLVKRVYIKGRVFFEVKWAGFPQNTLEKRSDLMKDIPDMIKEYEKNHKIVKKN